MPLPAPVMTAIRSAILFAPQTMKFQRARMDDMLKQADEMTKTIALMQRMYGLMKQMVGTTHRMVADTEGEVRRLLDHAGLPFEDACLTFWTNERAVRTASSEQVLSRNAARRARIKAICFRCC